MSSDQDNTGRNIFLGVVALLGGAMLYKAMEQERQPTPSRNNRKATQRQQIKQDKQKKLFEEDIGNPSKGNGDRQKKTKKQTQEQKSKETNIKKVKSKNIQTKKQVKDKLKKQILYQFPEYRPEDFEDQIGLERKEEKDKAIKDSKLEPQNKLKENHFKQDPLDFDTFEIDQDGFPVYNSIYFQEPEAPCIEKNTNIKPALNQSKSNQHEDLETDSLYQLLLCPISSTIMKQPVFISTCGHTYEKKQIQSWLNSHSTCPLCNKRSSKINIVPNTHLKQIIEQYEKNKKKK